MTNKKLFSFDFLKQKGILYNLLFYVSFLTTVLVSITMDSQKLLYFMPIVIFTIILKYVSIAKYKSKIIFIIGLLTIMVSDFLTFYNFNDYFMWITILTSFYLICCSLILKTFLIKGKLKAVLYLSVCIGILLVSYIIYSVLDLIIMHIPQNMLFYVILNAFSLLIFTVICAMIYINDHYDNATILLGSGIFTLFHIGLIPINEFIADNQTFTVLSVISHVLAIYLFMKFIALTDVIKVEDIKEKYF